MKIYTKSYAVKEYSYGVIKYEEVKDRDPYLISDDGSIHCFSFCDVSYIENEGKIYHTERYNYSNKVYFGTRYNVEEFKEIYGTSFPLLVEALAKSTVKDICIIRNIGGGVVALNNGDITYDELMNQKTLKK